MEYSEIVAKAVELNVLKHNYLLERGWTTADGKRWRFLRQWGSGSYKVYEADLNDAVKAQAQFEGHLD